MNFPKQVSTLAWLIGGALLVAFSILVIFLPDTTAMGSVQTASVILAEQVPSGFPVRLKIPAIQVDAAVLPVGLNPDGAMDTPKGPADVAWFDKGALPGEKGSLE